MDTFALQTALLPALQQALADVKDLREAQGSMQLTVMGWVQGLAAEVRALQAAGLTPGAASTGGLQAAAGAAGAAAGGPAPAGSLSSASSAASLAALLDTGDVDMAADSGGEEGAQQQDGMGPAGEEGDFAGLSDSQVVDLLLQRLEEEPAQRKMLEVGGQSSKAHCPLHVLSGGEKSTGGFRAAPPPCRRVWWASSAARRCGRCSDRRLRSPWGCGRMAAGCARGAGSSLPTPSGAPSRRSSGGCGAERVGGCFAACRCKQLMASLAAQHPAGDICGLCFLCDAPPCKSVCRQKVEAAGLEPQVLRGYQQRVVEAAKAGGN